MQVNTAYSMNKLGFLILVSLFSLLILVLPSKIFAQELPTIGANLAAYVPPTGSECDINIPAQYPTIQAGINAASSGNTVCVGTGNYNEDVIVDKSIRLSGRGSDKSIINGQGQNYFGYGVSAVVIPNSSGDNVTLEGFRINGVGTAPFDPTVLLFGSFPGAKIQYNHIVSGNSGFAFKVEWIRTNDIIQNNIFEGNNSNQIINTNHNGPAENEQILNNTFTGTVMVNSSVSDSGVVFKFGGKNSIIKHNVFSTGGMVYELMQITYTPNIVTENNFNSPTDRKIRLSGGNAIMLNAENNWWGSTDPSANIFGDIDYSPFALSPFPEYSLNQTPTVGIITAPTTPIQVNTTINASANFTDQNIFDTHTASWDWGDGDTTVGTVTESNGSGSVSDTHIYTTAGVYTITLTVADNNGATGASIFQYVSVYNPTPQGLFTGNRIFSSPSGAYPQNPNLTGQVQFGVTSKYQNTALIGNVSMNFRAANLEFDGTTLTALVISNGQATLRGTGTVNGSGNYNLLVTGLDGPQDAVRFQIKDQVGTVIYDSQLGAVDTATPTASVTGQIIVH